MKIYCHKCKKYLGEIRDATIRKGIVYLCRDCYADGDMDFLRGFMGMK